MRAYKATFNLLCCQPKYTAFLQISNLQGNQLLDTISHSHCLQYRYLDMMTKEREQRIVAAAQKQAIAQLGPEQIHQLRSLPEVCFSFNL